MKRVAILLTTLLCFLTFAAFSPPYLCKEIEIYLDDEGLAGDLTIEVAHAMRAERAGGYEALYDALLEKYSARDALNYLAVRLGDYLSAECERRQIDPLDATLRWNGNTASPFIYYEEKAGRSADLAEVGRQVARAMDNDARGIARAYTHAVAPKVTVDILRDRTREIARYSTSFATSGEGRRQNIALAASLISGKVLEAGARFSFNETVGVRTAERGFREANIIVNGEFRKGIGGGVCQVSTTLYNAVLLASLTVENAAAHSCPVSYVPPSRDCTVSSATDFTFRNDMGAPIYLAAEIEGSTLTVVIYGDGAPCSLESEVTERIPFSLRYEDGSLVSDTSAATLLTPGREGIRSRLYRVREGKRTLIRENYYLAKDAVYKKAV